MRRSRTPSAPLEVKRFEWGIDRENFDEDDRQNGFNVINPIKSDSFIFGSDNTKSSWSLSLLDIYDDDHNGDYSDYLNYGLSLVPAPGNPSNVNIKIKVGVIMKDGREANVRHCRIYSGRDVCGCAEFLKANPYDDDSYFRDDKLTIFCDLEMGRESRVSDLSLSQDFSRMLDSEMFTDFTLAVGEGEFKVHRAVLASRSPVFEKMFENDTKEKQDGRVEIKDEELDVVGMKGLLQFMYSGEVKDLEKIALKVLPAADKYGVDELKTLCEKAIDNKWTVKDAPSKVKRFRWKINRDEFTDYEEEYAFEGPTNRIKSQGFTFDLDNGNSSWSLSLQKLRTDQEETHSHYSLNIVSSPEEPSSVDIKVKVGVITKEGREDNVKQCQIFPGTDVWGLEFLPRLVSSIDDYFRKNKLTIFCDLQTVRKIRVSDFSFSQDFSRMFDNGMFTDFTLVVGEEELKAHRAVLAARSSFFEAMFEHDTKEKKDGRVEIKDLDVVGMKGLLQFMYSGEVKDLEEVAVQVLPAADYYGMDELKTLCEKTISNKLTVKNVPSFLLLADQYSAECLRTEALEFIKKNSVEVEEEEVFYELAEANPEIFKEIVKYFAACAKRVNECKCNGEPKEKRIKLN